MSHDRGCQCGREKFEYIDCTSPFCYQLLVPDTQSVKVDAETDRNRGAMHPLGHRLVKTPAPERNFGNGLS
jgi:hypothetical protein